ncbi:hypothetical protein N5T66_10605 [Aliarcobacter cryaerophilus]|jgi:hypothetical protein|uniref:hypothetical protein n=1 Tax=Aliarcobacter cryaerophilus TaxID=28198 RepID=UPI0021B28C45|nr:hypothetical protein [Aliarcobacter cryaerophilus]MCT7433739.1 hypothetical protein [Aliarcobacter cryaerophilus]
MNSYTPPYKISSKIHQGESTSFIEFMLEMILKSIETTLKSDQKSNYKSDQKSAYLEVKE